MGRCGSLFAAGLLFRSFTGVAAFPVDIVETLAISEASVSGQYDRIQRSYGFQPADGVDPLDTGCAAAGRCIGALTRDGSQDLDSRYGCTRPEGGDLCGVRYDTSESRSEPVTISSVQIALHPDSVGSFNITLNSDLAFVEQWEATSGTSEMQEITVLQGLELSSFQIEGIMEEGEYLGILEVAIFVEVDELGITGVSPTTRTTISATVNTDLDSVVNLLDGDATDASSWTCVSGELCDINYDLQAAESLEQIRIAFSENSDPGGQFNIMAAGESGDFFPVRLGIEAGGRTPNSDGLQTFGGMLAVARYVKIEVVPSSGGSIVINEIEFRVGVNAPTRPVAEKKWLKPTGPLPRAASPSSSGEPSFDARSATDGGCDSPNHFEGCRVIFIKDGDMDTRWSCGLADGDCEIDIGLNYFRYVRQIQFAFHLGDEQHAEFNLRAFTAQGWVTVVPSAITSGDTTGYQTFDVSVHTSLIRLTLRHQRYTQWIGINEVIILERRKNDVVAGTLPVFSFQQSFGSFNDDEDQIVDTPTKFKFDIPDSGDWTSFRVPDSTVTAVRMRFPANRKFVFQLEYDVDGVDVVDEFTTAGGPNTWEEFTLSRNAPNTWRLRFFALSGPVFDDFPDYPTLRVVDFQVVGEPTARPAGYFEMVSTNIADWDVIPDIIADGVSDQEEIMTAICETKGATFDGTDCVGELDDSTVFIQMHLGDHFVDGPIFIKSGVTLSGSWIDESPTFSFLYVYGDSNSVNTGEDGIIVIDGAIDAEVNDFALGWKEDPTGDIVPGTLGNLGFDVRNSQDLRFENMAFEDLRTGVAQFSDSRNISSFQLFTATLETGNYMELTRVDDFVFEGFPGMPGLRIDDSNNVLFLGIFDEYNIPSPKLNPPSTAIDQTASVVITGDSTGVVFKNVEVGEGPEPRIIMESTAPLTLDTVEEYEDAVSGDCIVQVPEGSSEDTLIQINSPQNLVLSANCWVLE